MSINWSNKTAKFWGEEDIVQYGSRIVLIAKATTDPRSPRWPGNAPSISEIYRELEISRMSYFLFNENDDKRFIQILSGRFIVKASISGNKDGIYRIWLIRNNSVEFATIAKRQKFIAHGVRVEHQGIYCIDPDVFRTNYENQDHYWISGQYAINLWHIKSYTSKNDKSNKVGEEENFIDIEHIGYNQVELSALETLEQYVESSYAKEQLIAAQERPFYFRNFHAIPRSTSYKQFFSATIEPDDYERLTDQKPSLLQVRVDEETNISLEVVDFEPDQGKTNIILASAGGMQIEANMIAQSDQLHLDASPVIRNTLLKVIEQLQEKRSTNKWLVPLAAGTYNHPKSQKAVVAGLAQTNLNPSQKDGVEKGAGSKDYTLVLGPPGTGKTTVILQWVNYFVAQGKRILVTSQNNKAVDNVLERLAREDSLECLRVGNETKVSDEIHNLLIDNYATNIQKKLTVNIEKASVSLQTEQTNLALLIAKLPQIETKVKEISNYDKDIETIKNNELVKLEQQLKDLSQKIEKFQKTISQYISDAEKYQLAAHASAEKKGFFSFFHTLKSKYLTIKAENAISKRQDNESALAKHSSLLQQKTDAKDAAEKKIYALQMQKDTCTKEEYDAIAFIKSSQYIDNTKYTNLLRMNLDGNERKNLEKDLQKISHLQKILAEWKMEIFSERQQSLYQTLLEFVDVVGATCIGINTNRVFSKIPFDVVIVDESGQIQLHNLMVPLSKAPQAILVGDHKQLPPIKDEELIEEISEHYGYDTEWLEKSWFEMLWAQAPDDRKAMLDTQFRCPSIISDFISKAFYENKYFAGEPMKTKQPILSFCKSTMVFIDTSRSPNNLESSKKSEGGRLEVMGNRLETEVIVKLVDLIVRESPEIAENNELGIIVPYANHVVEIKNALKNHVKMNGLNMGKLAIKDLVASVDSYQGQERDIILFAFSRSNPQGSVGFLADWRRLNVAMTRTKKQLIMIGNFQTLTKLKPGGHDEGFKVAMQTLQETMKTDGQIIEAHKLLEMKGM